MAVLICSLSWLQWVRWYSKLGWVKGRISDKSVTMQKISLQNASVVPWGLEGCLLPHPLPCAGPWGKPQCCILLLLCSWLQATELAGSVWGAVPQDVIFYEWQNLFTALLCSLRLQAVEEQGVDYMYSAHWTGAASRVGTAPRWGLHSSAFQPCSAAAGPEDLLWGLYLEWGLYLGQEWELKPGFTYYLMMF